MVGFTDFPDLRLKAVNRKLTYEERAVWGECPVCHAKHGEKCDFSVGIPLGVNVNGEHPKDGAHFGRLMNAPYYVSEKTDYEKE